MRGSPVRTGDARARPSPAGPGSAVAALAALAAAALAGCAHGPAGPGGDGTALPPIPEVRGAPSLYVAYPDSLDPVFAADSNFVFGTVGTGGAELTVNGHPVPVNANGSFLAWLPLPDPVAGDTARYRLVARVGDRVDTLVHRFRVPLRADPGRPPLWADSASAGEPERWVRPGEEVELTLSAAPGLDVRLEAARAAWWSAARDTAGNGAGGPDRAPGGAEGRDARAPVTRTLEVREAEPGRYVARGGGLALLTGLADAADGGGQDRAGLGAGDPPDGFLAADTLALRWRLARGGDTAVVRGRAPLRVIDPDRPPSGVLLEAPHPVHGLAGAVAGRPEPHGSYAWLLPPGSRAPVEARRGDRIRLRLGPGLAAWAAAEDVALDGAVELPPGSTVPTAGVGTVSAEALDDRVRIRVPVGRRLPAHAEVAGPRTLALTVHGGLSGTERMRYPVGDGLVRGLRWEQLPGPRWRLRVELSRPVWGWDLRWEDVSPPAGEGRGGTAGAGGAAGATGGGDDPRPAADGAPPSGPGSLVLDVRRPPTLDPGDPLDGVRVAVDPGHPPVGAEGPTGLTEAEANLGVARRLVRRLREAGAEPVLVREDDGAVGLYERRRRARAAGADLLVSLHNNALPDGVRPFGEGGTSTYYFHPHARDLARRVQRGMLEAMGLRDRGVRWGNLSLPRESWMPSVLTEGAFMMIPRHEAALRTPGFQDAYARGVLEGIRRWLADRVRGGG